MKYLHVFVLLLSGLSLYAQTDCKQLAEPIEGTRFCGLPMSLDVELFNLTCKHFNLGDTIAYRCDGSKVTYSYQGEALTDWSIDNGKKLKIKASSSERYGNALTASVINKSGAKQMYKLFRPMENPQGLVLIRYSLIDDLMQGDYREETCTGTVLAQGSYRTLDTTYTIRTTSFDPNTYQEVTKETNYNTLAVRSGEWIFRNNENQEIKRENYPGSIQPNPETAFCSAFRGSKTNTDRRMLAAFERFNDLTYLLNRPYWLTLDNDKTPPIHYLNGSFIKEVSTEVIDSKLETFNVDAGKTTIEITARIPRGAALNKGIKRKPAYLKAKITHADGTGELILLDDTTINYFQLKDGLKSGVYRKQDCSGHLLAEGTYCQRDTFYLDTVTAINPATYETEVRITAYTSVPMRVGIWRRFDTSGKAINEEDYGTCRE